MAEFASGTIVAGRYKIESALGKGGMGAVYVAWDEKFDRRLALKISVVGGSARETFKARFKREARLGDLLGKKEGFVRALDWGELPDGVHLYLAMDLVEGGEPLDLEAGSRKERIERLAGAAALVGQAHERGVIHRDLKPDNFLQGPDGQLSLADFGLGKQIGAEEPEEDVDVSGLTSTGVGMGTPRYMPPEQYDDASSVDARADVYALGVMLFHALTGDYPYAGRTPTQIMGKQQRVLAGREPAPAPRTLDPTIPEPLDALCRKALALEVEARLPSVDALIAGLRDVTTGAYDETLLEAVPVPPPGDTRVDPPSQDERTLTQAPPSVDEGATTVPPPSEPAEAPDSSEGATEPPAAGSGRGAVVGVVVALALVGLGIGWATRDRESPDEPPRSVEPADPDPPVEPEAPAALESIVAPPAPQEPKAAADAFESNNAIKDATPVELGRWVWVSMDPEGDVDVFRLEVPGQGYLTEPKALDVPGGVKLTFTLQNEAREEIPPSWPIPVQAGVYTVTVKSSGASGETFPLSFSWLAEFDDAEPNPDRKSPAAIALGKKRTVAICPPGDHDWFVFEVTEPGYVTARFEDGPEGFDINFQCYGPKGKVDFGRNTAWRLEPGKYLLHMWEWRGRGSTQAFPFWLEFAPEFDDAEPNPSAKAPKTVAFGETLTVALYPPADSDWFAFEVTSPGYVTRWLEEPPAGFDIYFQCFGPKGKVDFGRNTAWRLEPGRYTVRMWEWHSRGSTRTFPLRFEFKAEYDKAEPNPDAKTARAVAFGEKVTVALYPPGDRDWFAFEVTEPGYVTRRFEELPTGFDVYFQCYGPKGKVDFGRNTAWRLEPGRYTVHMWEWHSRGSTQTFPLWFEFKAEYDAAEPNPDVKTAKAIVLGEKQTVALYPPGDRDWFAFEVTEPGYVTRGFEELPKGFDVYFQCFGPKGKVDFGRNTAWRLEPGRYTVVMWEWHSRGSPQTFPLWFEFKAEYDTAEPNPDVKTAKAIVLGEKQTVALYPPGDRDWFAFEVTEPGYVTRRFEELPKGFDVYFQCFGPKGKVDFGRNTAWRLGPGKYTVLMWEWNQRASPQTFPLWFEFKAEYDTAEPNPDAKAAKPLAFGAKQTVALYPPGDLDWFAFEVTQPGAVTVRTEEPPPGLDIYFQCYGPKGKVDFGRNTTWSLEPGKYTLRMWEWNRRPSTQTFPLWLEFVPK